MIILIPLKTDILSTFSAWNGVGEPFSGWVPKLWIIFGKILSRVGTWLPTHFPNIPVDILAPVTGWRPGRLPVCPPTPLSQAQAYRDLRPLIRKLWPSRCAAKTFFYQHYKSCTNMLHNSHYASSAASWCQTNFGQDIFIIYTCFEHKSFRLATPHFGFPLKHFPTLQFLLPQATSQRIFFSRFIIRRWTRLYTPVRPLLGVRAGLFINVAERSLPFHALNKAKWSYVEELMTTAKRRSHLRSRIGHTLDV